MMTKRCVSWSAGWTLSTENKPFTMVRPGPELVAPVLGISWPVIPAVGTDALLSYSARDWARMKG
jgi:hypothetical protein